jgi:YidC/Oxa1 family membrane protein insertase
MRWIATLSAAMVLVGIAMLPTAAQNSATPVLPDPKYNSKFVAAERNIIDQNLDKAFDEYKKVKEDNAGTDPALAADAVLRVGIKAYEILSTPHTPEFNQLAPDVKEARLGKEQDFAKKSHDFLRTLRDEPRLTSTPAAVFAAEPHWANGESGKMEDLKSAMESRIDARNSAQLSYQFVDKLVRLSGAHPEYSYCLALILIALIVKTITFPLTLRTYKSQREMQKIQPLLKDLQEKYKGKPELNEKMMALYKEHNVNPFASCVPMFVQLPFMYYVYNTIRLYEFHFSHGKFLWIGSTLSHQFPAYLATDLSKFDLPLLAIYAVSNYITMKLNPSPDPAQAQQQQTMSLMMTVMFFWMFMKYQWSAAFIFYWLILNFITAFQQYNYIYKPNRLKAAAVGDAPAISAAPRNVGPVPTAAAGSRPRPKARKRK